LIEFVKGYRKVLDQLEKTLDDDFPLWDVIEKFDREQEFTEELAAHRQRQGRPAEGTTTPTSAAQPSEAQPSQPPSAAQQPTETQPSANPQQPPAEPTADTATSPQQ
jgi:hypothetical protein